MQKNHLRDYIKNHLPKVDKTNKYHPVLIEHAIEKAINGVFTEIALKNPHELDQYTKEYSIALVQDGTSLNYTATLTHPYIPIPDKRNGVRFIEAQGDYAEILFMPMTQKEFYLYPNTNASKVSDRIPYYLDRTKVYFYSPSSAVTTAGVVIHQLIPFTVYSDTDNVVIPDGMDGVVVKMALEHLGIIQPVDLADDNKDRQV